MSKEKILCLFDVDGTLTRSRQVIDPQMNAFLMKVVKPHCLMGLVGGSDFKKISEQMNGDDVISRFDFVFPENGLVQYKYGQLTGKQSIQSYIGEEKLQTFINFCLGYLSKITLPVKRGTFIEFRTGLINVSPIGRSCSQEERDNFEKYDKEYGIRNAMIEALKEQFGNTDLTYSIGGQISFDAFPTGWDKTYCLRHILEEGDREIHFFGDKTEPGGNDYEISRDPRVIAHKVTGPEDTKRQLEALLNL